MAPSCNGALARILAIFDRIQFLDRTWHVMTKGDGFLIQLSYEERDVETGKIELQKSRKHYVSPHMTESEIVETAFLCAQRSMEHVLREHFTYLGQRVYSPHFSIEGRLGLCRARRFDKRPDKRPSALRSGAPIGFHAPSHESMTLDEALDEAERQSRAIKRHVLHPRKRKAVKRARARRS